VIVFVINTLISLILGWEVIAVQPALTVYSD